LYRIHHLCPVWLFHSGVGPCVGSYPPPFHPVSKIEKMPRAVEKRIPGGGARTSWGDPYAPGGGWGTRVTVKTLMSILRSGALCLDLPAHDARLEYWYTELGVSFTAFMSNSVAARLTEHDETLDHERCEDRLAKIHPDAGTSGKTAVIGWCDDDFHEMLMRLHAMMQL